MLFVYLLYQNEASLNMCSKCYKDHSANDTKKAVPLSIPASLPSPVLSYTSSSSVQPPKAIDTDATMVAVNCSTDSSSSNNGRPVQENTKKCWTCNKKIGLTGFKCRCGYFYCGTHRYSDMHPCDFDYKALAKDELSKSNPLVMASKVDKI